MGDIWKLFDMCWKLLFFLFVFEFNVKMLWLMLVKWFKGFDCEEFWGVDNCVKEFFVWLFLFMVFIMKLFFFCFWKFGEVCNELIGIWGIWVFKFKLLLVE